MEAKQFAELLKSPLLVAQLPADALRELVQRYPFSASLQMLLLKHYQLNDHPAYDEQLAKAAVYAPDRRALYRLVQLREIVHREVHLSGFEPQSASEEPLTEEPEEETVVVEKDADLPTWHVEPLVYDGQDSAVTEEEPLFTEDEVMAIETETPDVDEAPDVTEGAVENEEQVLVSDENTVDETSVEQQEPISFVPLVIPEEHFGGLAEETTEPEVEEPTVEIETDAVIAEDATTEESSITVEEEPEVNAEAVTETVAEETEADTATTEVFDEVEREVESVEEPIIEKVVQPETRRPTIKSQTDSFAGWLQRVKHHDIPTATPKPLDAEDLQEQAALDALFGAGTYEATLVQESISLTEEEPIAKVPPTREELMEPDDEANRKMDEQAKKSLTMGNELVTETLARIYEIQKKTGKAIEAYEILKVRFPEKVEQYNAKIQALREI